MTSKRGKLTLDKQTVRSLRARSSIRAGLGDPDNPYGTTSGFNKCMEPPPDPDPVAAPAARGTGGMRTPVGDSLRNGKLPI